MLFVVIEIFDDFLKHYAAQRFKMTDAALGFAKVICESVSALRARQDIGYILCTSSMRRMVPDMQAADRRTWNSKPSAETRVTYGESCLFVSAIMVYARTCRTVGTVRIDSR